MANETGGTGLHPIIEVLIAQLRHNGTLSDADLDMMHRRLDEGGDIDHALALNGILLSDDIDTPDRRRKGLHLVTAVTDRESDG